MTMKTRFRIPALAAALALAVHPVAASAQDCLAQDEVSAMAIYAMPGVVQGVKMRCAPQLGSNGFLATGGQALSARYAKLQPAVWPKAKTGILKIAAKKAKPASRSTGNVDALAMISALPDNAVRPLVDALIVQEVGPQIDIKQCGRVELLMQALSRVDPEIAGTLLGLIAGLVKLDEAAVCEA